MKPGRNDPCPCGSGKKYKKCCGANMLSVSQNVRQQTAPASAGHVARPAAPTPDETTRMIALFNAGRYVELEQQAKLLIAQYPDSGFAWKVLGATLQVQGKEAIPALRQTAKLLPNYAAGHNNLGAALQRIGQFAEAEASCRQALAINPDFAEAHNNLGNVLLALGQLDEAVVSYREALKIKPDYADAHSNLGAALLALGQIDEAVVSYRRALAIEPKDVETHSNLGNALQSLGQFDDAVTSYRCALTINPDYAELHNKLGNTLQSLGQIDEAVVSYRQALTIKPDYAEAHNNLGSALRSLGQLDGAMASCYRALQIKPDYAEAYCNLGTTQETFGQLSDASTSFRRALEIRPEFALAYCNLGVCMQRLERPHEAVANLRRALEIMPDYAEAHNNLGIALLGLGQIDDAVASYRRALAIKPDFAAAHNNLGNVLQALGQLDEAVASYRRALAFKPDFAEAYSNLLFCLSHFEAIDAPILFAEHCRFGEQFEAPLRASWPPHANSREPERRLQVGFVSADLRNHAIATFIEPVLAHLSRYPQLSLHAYYNYAIEDATTHHLRGYFAHWHRIVGLSDSALAQKISADGIDILIDLSSHTAHQRLLSFAHKPAPVQASWMGYPGTTGLRAMDYYLTDKFFLPHAQFASQFTEKFVYLPASAPFMPSNEAPAVNALPALGNGYITFGSFNRLNKISRSVIALWSQLLRASPQAILLMGGLPGNSKYSTLLEWFAEEGITQDRLRFHGRSDMKTYLALHHQVDICLDTFPYNGGTTTLHALWMGVPTLTLTGSTGAGRTGAAILGRVGLGAFIAHTAEAFVETGQSCVGNLAALSAIRSGLRERLATSAIGRPALIADGLERAFRIMWQRWCEGLPPLVIDVSDHEMNLNAHPIANEQPAEARQ